MKGVDFIPKVRFDSQGMDLIPNVIIVYKSYRWHNMSFKCMPQMKTFSKCSQERVMSNLDDLTF